MANRTNHLFAQIAHAATADVDHCKSNISGEQLAHILTMMAGRNLLLLNSGIGGVPNQVITESKALMHVGIDMEQFNDVSTWLATDQYHAEDYLQASYMSDGSDMEQSFNYNHILIGVGIDIDNLFISAGIKLPDWVADYSRAMGNRFRFLLSMMRPNGMLPGLDLSSDGDASDLMDYQGYLQDVLAQQINSHIWGNGSTSEPAFTSIAFPFGGYYIIRDGWDPNSNHLFMKGSRMGKGHMDESGKQIQVTAFGRTMSIDSGGSYSGLPQSDYCRYSFGHNTIIVDGLSQCMGGEHSPAYEDTIGTRWHSSDHFDALWHSDYTPMERRPVWIVGVWHPNYDCRVSLDGVLNWKLGLWEVAYVAWSIGKLTGIGVYTPLFEGPNGSGTLPIGTVTTIGDLRSIEELQNILLGEAESLVFDYRGPHYNHRLGTFKDSAVTITTTIEQCVIVPADFNGDCIVDFIDIITLSQEWLH